MEELEENIRGYRGGVDTSIIIALQRSVYQKLPLISLLINFLRKKH